ncbi:MAG TPA: SIS domain-containing protein [Patescibacteria group bacterium]|nr:SIS domain-containing protein [Patescibacteria group bacterium]
MNLDNREDIKKLDISDVLSSIESLPMQCLHAWEDASKVVVPESYKDINKIVMCGMGGSGLGARVIESVYGTELKQPLVRVNDYHLPRWVDEKTLVICSSYSGETEETIQNLEEAISKNAKVMSIGSGNSLINKSEKLGIPFYKINPLHNPSNQPRMAIGYSIIGQLVMASKAGVIKFTEEDLSYLVEVMRQGQEKIKVEVVSKNEAKKLANRMKDKIISFISSNHMVGATHVVNNQLNENAKTFSTDYIIPELNHHLLEGLSYPELNKTALFSIFVNSNLYSERIKKRYALTTDVVKKHDVEVFEFKAKSKNFISQAFEFIQFGVYVNFYLSMLYKINPAPLPWVDYFKVKLGQPLGIKKPDF